MIELFVSQPKSDRDLRKAISVRLASQLLSSLLLALRILSPWNSERTKHYYGKISIYIDGELFHSNTISGPWRWDPAQPLEFGKSHDGYWQCLDGYLDDIRIYNRRLSTAEIAEVMTPGAAGGWSNVTGNPPSPVETTIPASGNKFYRLQKP